MCVFVCTRFVLFSIFHLTFFPLKLISRLFRAYNVSIFRFTRKHTHTHIIAVAVAVAVVIIVVVVVVVVDNVLSRIVFSSMYSRLSNCGLRKTTKNGLCADKQHENFY